MIETTVKLDALAELMAKRDALATEKRALIAQIMPEEIARAINDVESEYQVKETTINANISSLEEDIKADVLASGATVKGLYFMAVWNKGRVSWDSKKLDGMIALIPQLAAARKEGDPTVSLRKI